MKVTRNQLNFKGVKEFTGNSTRNDDKVEFINKELKLLKELIEFNILKGIDENKSQSLFDAVIAAVEKAGLDVEHELLIQFIRATSAIIDSKATDLPELVSLLTVLIKSSNNCDKSELIRYCCLINKFEKTDDKTLAQWIKILTALGENVEAEKANLLFDVQSRLEIHSVLLEDISSLFNYPPYPTLDVFSEKLHEYSRELKLYIDSFDRDPAETRASKVNQEGILLKTREQILNEQFDTSQIQEVVAKIQNVDNGAGLSCKEQSELAQQVVFINAIGKDFPLKVANANYTDLTQLSRNKLRELSDLLITEMRRLDISKEDKLRTQLKLVAVMREQYFRSTGLFFDTTQIISLLLSLHHQEQNVLMEVSRNENSSAPPAAVLAAMQWVLAEGGTVDVCFANHVLIAHDYLETGDRDFFTYLGIPSSVVEANSEFGTYQVGGINYSTLSDLTSYRSHAAIEDEELSIDRYGYPVSSHLILNDIDFSNVDDRTLSYSSSLLDDYKGKGRVLRITEIDEIAGEVVGQTSRFDMAVGYRIFPARKNLREELNTQNLADARREEAVKQYVIQSVSNIQQVVLNQLEEWQAFLHLIYPKSEWRQLNNELFVQRNDLIDSLKKQWTKCLEDSDPKKIYPNPYVRRDVFQRIQTRELEKAIQVYEKSVSSIWSLNREQLKAKTENRFSNDSVNALRCKYLQEVDLSEQIKWSKLSARLKKKEAAQEKKRSHRHLESAVEVTGAMLSYHDGDLEPYRLAFVNSQLNLWIRDISKEINNSSLPGSVKQGLIERTNNADNFLALELLLIDYESKWLDKEKLSEKFRMQPIISDMLRVYQLAGFEEHKELQILKETYLDNTAAQIIHHLDMTLAWAKPENRGPEYWIERTAVKKAANEILAQANEVKQARDSFSKQAAIKKLYRALCKHQAQLEDVWIFSFGHKNTRDLINQTLNTMDGLTVLGREEGALDVNFIQECKEEAQYYLLQEKYNSILEEFEKNNSQILNANSDWRAVKRQLQQTQNGNCKVYTLNEMYYVLCKKISELSISYSLLREPLVQLRGMIRTLWNSFQEKHQDIIDESKYFAFKAQKIKEELEGVEGYSVFNVKIKKGYTGFNEYVELIIEGEGTSPLFEGFMQYKSRLTELTQAYRQLEFSLKQNKLEIRNLNRIHAKQLPLLKEYTRSNIEVDLFPEQCRSKVKEILALKEWINGQIPEDLSQFPEDMQNHFLDRNSLKTMDRTTMTMEQIDEIKDGQLKADLAELYNKMHKINVEESKSWLSAVANRIVDLIPSFFRQEETEDDWRYQFNELQGRSDSILQSLLTKKIMAKYDALIKELVLIQRNLVQQLDSGNKKIQFLRDKILEEERKTNAIIKRFDNLNDFYDFEAKLKRFKAVPPTNPVNQAPIESKNISSSYDEKEFPNPEAEFQEDTLMQPLMVFNM
ncbi:hypothetical protein [Legionella pneumophila]|uniref:LigA, interaptin n=1 Tax=Legionella pneumophila subsp. pascullei TaxID=91890 RepID=A0AAX2IUD2_LEGPN|nr:hypothetical protein [Legionella pneumophila]AMP90587.1 hypothetical protein AXF35_13130 [Legionella pneumophila subsp. pascullei]AMP91721.1 aromatic ring-opening dioxygenase LigA [Legionella pneumophila subsp. pascullei]AMP94710.1 aromatic ring-opening dioxygenase LigA [Legionella pneumophila subsp. pascullei]SQG89533.1 LigA, interaptin [Legionella pneumophila subsp. pascullei]VEH04900.1 LigA, interaptin [Legionella pneumophila subsp. pascullei]